MPLLPFKDRFAPAVHLGALLLSGTPEPEARQLVQQRYPEVDAATLDPKYQTIRAYRKDGRDPQPGQTLHCYEKTRTPQMALLGRVPCMSVEPVKLTRPHAASGNVNVVCGDPRDADTFWLASLGDGSRGRFDEFARADGFREAGQMVEFFHETHGLPFEGLLIRWGPLAARTAPEDD